MCPQNAPSHAAKVGEAKSDEAAVHDSAGLDQEEGELCEVAAPEQCLVATWKLCVCEHGAPKAKRHDGARDGVKQNDLRALPIERVGRVAQLHGMLAKHNQRDNVLGHDEVRASDGPVWRGAKLELVTLTRLQPHAHVSATLPRERAVVQRPKVGVRDLREREREEVLGVVRVARRALPPKEVQARRPADRRARHRDLNVQHMVTRRKPSPQYCTFINKWQLICTGYTGYGTQYRSLYIYSHSAKSGASGEGRLTAAMAGDGAESVAIQMSLVGAEERQRRESEEPRWSGGHDDAQPAHYATASVLFPPSLLIPMLVEIARLRR